MKSLVDSNDLVNNASNFVSVIKPPGASGLNIKSKNNIPKWS